jgi:2'-5' RNA ligase
MSGNLFVSINVPIEISEKIMYDLDKVKVQKYCRGKFTPVDNFHLTLKFLGDYNKVDIENVKEKLSKIDFEKFTLRVGKLGFFEKGLGEILYAELRSSVLNGLVKEIWKELGWEYRKFKSHITLMRVKKILNLIGLKGYVRNFKFKWVDFVVDKTSLMKSELEKAGAEYSELWGHPLSSSPPKALDREYISFFEKGRLLVLSYEVVYFFSIFI